MASPQNATARSAPNSITTSPRPPRGKRATSLPPSGSKRFRLSPPPSPPSGPRRPSLSDGTLSPQATQLSDDASDVLSPSSSPPRYSASPAPSVSAFNDYNDDNNVAQIPCRLFTPIPSSPLFSPSPYIPDSPSSGTFLVDLPYPSSPSPSWYLTETHSDGCLSPLSSFPYDSDLLAASSPPASSPLFPPSSPLFPLPLAQFDNNDDDDSDDDNIDDIALQSFITPTTPPQPPISPLSPLSSARLLPLSDLFSRPSSPSADDVRIHNGLFYTSHLLTLSSPARGPNPSDNETVPASLAPLPTGATAQRVATSLSTLTTLSHHLTTLHHTHYEAIDDLRWCGQELGRLMDQFASILFEELDGRNLKKGKKTEGKKREQQTRKHWTIQLIREVEQAVVRCCAEVERVEAEIRGVEEERGKVLRGVAREVVGDFEAEGE
ncbi:hypothetical protein EX30DRAFT_364531 [Ascodesmis nigricans]|uniref:Uncharacterized protein n=1 Tax=Ascodesmis nigricans TaxID=341454 RepID=A0A4S2MUT9_9PEZI|nr:hypothetical protein EX30DRAFT_364531 [Ascodesmis nigricans]